MEDERTPLEDDEIETLGGGPDPLSPTEEDADDQDSDADDADQDADADDPGL